MENHTEIFTAKIIIVSLVSDGDCEFYKLSVGFNATSMCDCDQNTDIKSKHNGVYS